MDNANGVSLNGNGYGGNNVAFSQFRCVYPGQGPIPADNIGLLENRGAMRLYAAVAVPPLNGV